MPSATSATRIAWPVYAFVHVAMLELSRMMVRRSMRSPCVYRYAICSRVTDLPVAELTRYLGRSDREWDLEAISQTGVRG